MKILPLLNGHKHKESKHFQGSKRWSVIFGEREARPRQWLHLRQPS